MEFFFIQVSSHVSRIFHHRKNQLVAICQALDSFCIIVDQWTEQYTGTFHQALTLKRIY